MQLKLMLVTEIDGEPHKGKCVTVNLDEAGLASADEMVTKMMDYVSTNVHRIEGVQSHSVTSELIEGKVEKDKEVTFRIETTLKLLLNGEEVD